ncbi:MAG: glutamate--tRNA ligase [Sphingobacteriales bacterium]|nr:glutamate--tRNA ligase [Sphingobacteriales bacterium]
MERKVRVRFAPSPTGPLHMGGVRTALYNYLFAKKNGGDFILRIEDTDQTRYVPGAEQYIVDALAWCGITFDEGVHIGGPDAPYRQSERKEMYRQYAMQLIEAGHAYYAFDTTEELDEMRERLKASNVASPQYNYITRENMKNSLSLPHDEVERRLAAGDAYVIRIKIPRKEEIRVVDLIRGNVVVHSAQMDDKVLFKSDGMPTYHLANVVDDYLMKITHVIRGEEWLPSAPLHVLLYRYLGWEEVMPQFAHLPLLLKPDGNGKLSKRDGDRLGFPVFPLEWHDPASGEMSSGYREKGYFPEAFVNMLALLGWNPGTSQEIFTMPELIEAFSVERISKSGAKFDAAKTKWFNQQYLRAKSDAELAAIFQMEIVSKGITADINYVQGVCALIKEKAQFVNEFWSLAFYFFEEPTSFDEEIIKKRWKDQSPDFIKTFTENLKSLSDFGHENIENLFKQTAETMGVSPGSVMQIFRVAISGVGAGPAVFEMVSLIGKEKAIARLEKAMNHFNSVV